MVLSAVIAVGHHSTAPWYVAIPVVVVALGARFWWWRSRRRGGGGGSSRRGPFGGSGDGT
jgi:uncharacterized membrane protein YdfJ with MMPL/SSD domain